MHIGDEDELAGGPSLDTILNEGRTTDTMVDREDQAEKAANRAAAGKAKGAGAKTADGTKPSAAAKGAKQVDDDEGDEPEDEAEDEGDEERTPAQRATVKQARDERKRRQAAERERDELKERVARLEGNGGQQQQRQQMPQRPDPRKDAAGARQYDQWVQQESAWNDRVAFSQDIMRQLKPDYDDVEKAFLEAADKDPGLAISLRKSVNPARFAYDAGKRILAQKDIGDDPDAYKAKVRADILKEYGIDPDDADGAGRSAAADDDDDDGDPFDSGRPAKPARKPNIPPSLGRMQSTSPRGGRGYSGPTPLNKLVTGP